MEAREEEEVRVDEHMVFEILSKLHSKSLARCMCVCRSWRDLVSSRSFVELRTERAVNDALGMLSVTLDSQGGGLGYVPFDGADSSEAPDTTLGLSADGHDRRISVKAASNGLVFFKLTALGTYVVCNPTTKSVSHVPRPFRWKKGTRFGLAFDPAASPSVLRVVGCSPVARNEDPALGAAAAAALFLQFDVYSPDTHAWAVRDTNVACGGNGRLFDTVCSVFFARALHWMVEEGRIVAFNIDDERCYQIALPVGVQASQVAGYPSLWFGVVRGRMTLVKFHHRTIYVWEMEDYGRGEWRLRACVETPEQRARCYESNVPLHYDGERCVLLSWSRDVEERRECGLAVYRIGAGRWDNIRSLQGFMDSRRHFFPYISYMGGG